jgi:hypothetical protein
VIANPFAASPAGKNCGVQLEAKASTSACNYQSRLDIPCLPKEALSSFGGKPKLIKPTAKNLDPFQQPEYFLFNYSNLLIYSTPNIQLSQP